MPALGQRWVEGQSLEHLAVMIKRARDRFIQADNKYGELIWEACLRFDDEKKLVAWLTENGLSLGPGYLKMLVKEWNAERSQLT